MNKSESTKPMLRWFQFQLRTLLVLTLLCSLACSWFAVKKQEANSRRAAVAAMRKAGAVVGYDYEARPRGTRGQAPKPPAPEWLIEVLGIDFFADVVEVWFEESADDETMKRLEGLTHLQTLGLHRSQATDGWSEYLKGMANLETLVLCKSQVTDVELEHVKELTNLRTLWITDQRAAENGLRHLESLTNLRTLILGTQVNNASWLLLANMHVTDPSSLDRLAGLIRPFNLTGTPVTDVGVEELQQALPDCKISH